MTNTALIVFPSAAGHVNPSLPLCARLVKLGWRVEYLSIVTFQSAIESTGATFHDRNAVLSELGIQDVTSAIMNTFLQYGDDKAKQWALNFGSIATELLLPPYIEFFRRVAPKVIVYCPVLCQVSHFAAMHLRIPDVSLLTAAGPGFWDAAFAAHGGCAADLVSAIKANEANNKAIDGIRKMLSMPNLTLNTAEPLIHEYYTNVNIVSTIPSLADRLNDRDAGFYKDAGKQFEFFGPILGETAVTMATPLNDDEKASLFKTVREAIAANRRVIYISMGTVITGEDSEHGWAGTSGSAITGKQLCQSVYRAAFAELGIQRSKADSTSAAFLVVVSLGSQADALEGISVPDNAICLKTLPQAEILLLAKPALFITNGGQNSFIEAMSVGTPVLVCPGFGDQQSNAVKAETHGVGLKVDRPGKVEHLDIDKVLVEYQSAASIAIRKILGEQHVEFASKAQVLARELEQGGGANRAVEIILKEAGITSTL
eukprot:TRINITY_DN15399_c0_g1_i3.p1 TRINITY_DN15399_c0_g1~~TRINITY_DN15399_c0_g1_i3.p1  ORF type:complete len:486 (-),score=44.54 TRINITY_DN15399_c0_g1_i3:48-1505(-)